MTRPERSPAETTFADLAHGGFHSGAIGALVLAFVLLIRDLVASQALHTPSLLGGVLFAGASAATVEGVNLTWVALYTGVHVLAFQLLGWCAAAGYGAMRRAGRLGEFGTGFFLLLIIAGAYIGASATFMPGIASALGFMPLTLTSALTAAAMVLTLRWSFRNSAARASDSGRRPSRDPSGHPA